MQDLNVVVCPSCQSRVFGVERDSKALHEEIEIKCFYSGSATLMIEDQIMDVQSGDIVVINPYAFHTTIRTGADEDNGRYHLLMLPPELPELQTQLIHNGRTFITLHRKDQRLYGIIHEIVREYTEKEEAYELVVRGLVLELFAILLRKGFTEDSAGRRKDDLRVYRLIEPALRCIRDHFGEPVTVQQLSQLCNVSKSYFCRSFRAVTGKSAMAYLSEYRLKIAHALLRNSDRTVAHIAEACGFESVSYFSRSYKKHYGKKPSQQR